MEKQVEQKFDTFFSKSQFVSFKKGDLIIRAGEPIHRIYYLKEGLVRQYFITEEGHEVTLNLFKPISFFPIMLVLGKSPNNYYFQAETDLKMPYATPEAVKEFIKTENDILFDLASRFSDAILGLLTKIEHLMHDNAYAKTCFLLLYLSQQFGKNQENGILITLLLTHEDIASWIGLTRETTSRQLEKLAKKEIIEIKNKSIVVKDIEALKEESQLARHH